MVLIVTLLLVVTSVVVIGRERLETTRLEFRERSRAIMPYAGLLAIVLVANKIARDVGPDLSWLVGIRITGRLQHTDGILLRPLYPNDTPQAVFWLQSMATPELTTYFAFVYVYGYVFLLVFPMIAYFALSRPEPLRRTMVAYGANYLIGVFCYVVFIAYGPRNTIIDHVDGLLYSQYAQYQFVTTAVNHETNVFPSLHTSMAVTAGLLAWTTRDEYPVWVPISAVLAISVVISTMYLGIHWATDAIFGIVLGWISVSIATRFDGTPPTGGEIKSRLRTAANAIPGPR